MQSSIASRLDMSGGRTVGARRFLGTSLVALVTALLLPSVLDLSASLKGQTLGRGTGVDTRSTSNGPSTTGPSTTGPSTTGPSTTGPSTTGPSDGAKYYYVNVPRFTIPVRLNETVNIARVQIFASTDSGKTWEKVGDQDPRQEQFAFEPGADGEYWFSSRTIDRSNRVYGKFANGTPVAQLKLVVDRRRPSLNIEARPEPTGRVHLVWDATDPYLDHKTLRLEYRAGVDGPWRNIEVKNTPPHDGRVRGEMYWYPDTISRVVTIRGEILDLAGNREVKLVDRVFLPRAAADETRRDEPRRDEPRRDEVRRDEVRRDEAWRDEGQREDPRVGERRSNNFVRPEDASVWPRNAGSQSRDVEAHRQFNGGIAMAPNQAPANDKRLGNQVGYGPVTGDVRPGMGDNVEIPAAQKRPTSMYDTGFGQPAQMTAKPRFHLEYDLQFVGPEGAAEVQLWGTRDRGDTWENWGPDRDLKSPLDVQVDTEGLYGFCIVIVGKNGLSSPVPRPKTPADLWVGVDLTNPQCRLTAAEIGQGSHAGHVDLRWELSDEKLADAPVTLSFAESKDGPWQVIAANLKNEQYFWKIDNSVPQTVHVKIEATDAAGRRAEHIFELPVDTRTVAPRGRIRGIRSND